MPFVLKSDYLPCGDQPQAIEALSRGIRDGLKDELEGRRGMVSRVVRGGIINVGDAITVERSQPLAS